MFSTKIRRLTLLFTATFAPGFSGRYVSNEIRSAGIAGEKPENKSFRILLCEHSTILFV
jgi:hypothetical protein